MSLLFTHKVIQHNTNEVMGQNDVLWKEKEIKLLWIVLLLRFHELIHCKVESLRVKEKRYY